MTLTVEQSEAIERLESAVHHAVSVLGNPEPGEFVTGWIVVVNASYPDSDSIDEMDTQENCHHFHRRGQSITLSRGIAEQYLDYLRGNTA